MEPREQIEVLLAILTNNLLSAVYFEYDSSKRLTINEYEYASSKQLTAADLKAIATRLNVIADLMLEENPDA